MGLPYNKDNQETQRIEARISAHEYQQLHFTMTDRNVFI